MNILKLIIAGIVGVFVLSFAGGSFYVVDEGERTVIVNQGKISEISKPGFHWKTPFITAAHDISTRTQVIEFKDEPVFTADRQTAHQTFSVNYAAIPGDAEITAIYREFQSLSALEDRVLKRQVREVVKRVFGTFTADTAIRERGRLNAEISQAVSTLGDRLIKVEGINMENTTFSKQVEEAAELRAKAEMSVQTEKQNLEKEKILADKAIEQARGRAQSQLAEAKAHAEGVKLRGEAEAAAIKAKSDALAASPALVELTKAEKWNGALPTTMVPNATLPFMQMK